ncbi:Synaptosomal-associated protein 29 [Sarcoptes scabiei]|nr:Synaptosomal-associated protein 29 [Sarcoptes scabiei]
MMSLKSAAPNSNNILNSSNNNTPKLTYPCGECSFEAQSARQLSRHKAVTHTQNALKCVLCPFVTAYQTNLLRHRKDVHGICGSKGNKSCKFCGFVSDDNDTLIQHQIEFHRDILKTAQVKFAKELALAGGEDSVADYSSTFDLFTTNNSNNNHSYSLLSSSTSSTSSKRKSKSKSCKSLQSNFLNSYAQSHADDDDDEDDDPERNEFEEFWKAGFIDPQYNDHQSNGNYFGHYILSDLPNIESVPTSSRSSSPKSQSSSLNNIIRNSNCQQNGFEENGFLADNSQQAAGNENLPATRIRRQYNCNDCGFRTINPREFLYHRRDLHGYKVKIVECPYCVYACQYVQKLQRHLLLVHKLNLMHTIADGQFSGASDSMLDSNQQQEFLQQELNDQQQRNRKSIKKARIKSSNQKEFDEENENDNNESTLLVANHSNNCDEEVDDDEQNDYDVEDEQEERQQQYPKRPPMMMKNSVEKLHSIDHIHKNPDHHHLVSKHQRLMNVNNDDVDGGGISSYNNNNDSNEILMMELIGNDSTESNGNKKFKVDGKKISNLECSICKIKFNDANAAHRHSIKHHQTADGISTLNPTRKPKNLIQSLRNIEVDEKQSIDSYPSEHQQNIGDKKTSDMAAKNRHVCSICGYKTRWISELERHVRVHSNEKPFRCSCCNFRSKWKGDLNRHMQRYHPNSTNIVNNNGTSLIISEQECNDDSVANGTSVAKQDDEVPSEPFINADDYLMAEMTQSKNSDGQNDPEITSDLDNDDNTIGCGSVAKMYKCTLCDFMCSTASRFHVHYVQHLNTKPFQCSICGHRSNWEWDVTKHIKMKAQRDPNHEKAMPVLIHDSGIRDYSKYDRFVILVGNNENKQMNNIDQDNRGRDHRNKRSRNVLEDENDENDTDHINVNYGLDNILTPEVCFEVDGETIKANDVYDRSNYQNNLNFNRVKIPIIQSVVISRHPKSHSKLIQCSQCEFHHRFARVVVAHFSSHTQTKPYGCKYCPFETNWREMIINHCVEVHGIERDSNRIDFEMRYRCLIDAKSSFRIVSDEELEQFLEQQEQQQLCGTESIEHEQLNSNQSIIVQPSSISLIEPNIYEEKAVIRCDYCPFITTNMKKMSIHLRFHNQSKGSLKCSYCPYYVNNPEKLMRHEKLHQKIEIDSSQTVKNTIDSFGDEVFTNNFDDDDNNQSPVISCSYCPFQTYSSQYFKDHMINIHNRNPILENNSLYNYRPNDKTDRIANHNLNVNDFLIQSYSTNNSNDESLPKDGKNFPIKSKKNCFDSNAFISGNDKNNSKTNFGDKRKENITTTVSLISVSHMRNGNAKKFSYVCSECPAAFKSPGDFKIHAVFHRSNYQHPCPYCSYKARNKPQLCKHLYVHTAEYIAKRANSYPEGTKHLIERQLDSSLLDTKSENLSLFAVSPKNSGKQIKSGKKLSAVRRHRTKPGFQMKPARVKLNNEEDGKQNIVFNNTNQMAEQEFVETKDYLKRINLGIKNRCMYRCSKCPAVFTKVNTLIYHMTLHDQNGQYRCDSCSYSTEIANSLSVHSLLHNLSQSQTAMGYNFNYNCHKCPAGFSKRSRLEKHLSLHGAEFNWKCDQCDYSVRYAATLVKHRALHLINPDFQALEFNLEQIRSRPNLDQRFICNFLSNKNRQD